MSLDRFMTVDEVVANASTIIPEKYVTPRLRNLMRQWTYLGERQLGFSGTQIKVSDWIEVDNLTIQKPKDLAITKDLAIYDDAGVEYPYRYKGSGLRIHSGQKYPDIGIHRVGVSETPYNFHLDSNGDVITKALIRYYAYPIDERGDLMVPEHHALALMMFIRWMAFMRHMDEVGGAIGSVKEDWLRARSEARSGNKIPNGLDIKAIEYGHASMIDKIFHDNF